MAAEGIVTGSVWEGIAGAAEARAAGWIASARAGDESRGSALLGGMQRDPESFEFTRRLLELVAGTQDAFASALGLREIAQEVPRSMPRRDRIAVRAGGAASLGLPWAVMPVARRWMRERVSHLVVAARLPLGDDRAARLGRLSEALRRHAEAGLRPVVVPLGEAVHGPEGAAAEAARLTALAAHPEVRHLVVDPARLAPGGTDWSAEADLAAAAQALRPVLEAGLAHDTVVRLAPSSVRWARIAPALLVRALLDPALDRARVGIRLFAELPESREHYDRLWRWAQRRVADGGAPAEVVVGPARAAAAECVASIRSGLPVPVIEDPVELTAQTLRLAELALHPGRAAALRPVLATEDPRVLAAAAELADRLGSRDRYAVELRSGAAPGLAESLRSDHEEVRVAVPVVPPGEFRGAVDLLVAFAAEASDPGSAISRWERQLEAAGDAGAGGSEAAREGASGADGPDAPSGADEDPAAPEGTDEDPAARAAFRDAVELARGPAPGSHRTQRRAREWDPSERDSALFYRAPDEPQRLDTGGLTAAVLGLTRGSTGELRLAAVAPPRAIPVVSSSGFANEPETDATVPENREWARELLRRAADEAEERERANETVALAPADLDPEAAARSAREAGERWSEQPHRARAVRLRRAALATVAARDRLLQSLALDTGAPVPELDAEVNDVVDAARYCGQLAEGLAAVRGAAFVPDRLTLVASDTATPLSAQAEAVLAGLGAGSAVLWSVPQRLHRSASVLLEEWAVGGLPPGAVRLEPVVRGGTLGALAANPDVDRVVVLGDREAARELVRRRPDLPIEGRFRARGSLIVAPSADLDLAVRDVVASALRGAGSHPRAAHLAILLGSVARSRRFRDALADAVRGLRVGSTARPGEADPLAFDLGPLPAPPGEAGLRALTELGRGEDWLVRPRRLDDEGLLWSPGVRTGVTAGSSFWDDSRGLPVIGLAHAHTLTEALALQNAPGSGAVAGLQSSDPDEILAWLDGAEAAALALNRPTTEARIERQPGGGWNDAAMGLPALSGGPNRLLPLGSWEPREGTRSETLHLRGLDPEVQLLIEAAQECLSYEEFDSLRRAALADALAWRTSYGVVRDDVGLGVERNVLRTRPVTTQIRLAEGAPVVALVRVLAAALLVRAPVSVSTGEVPPTAVSAFLATQGIELSLERDDDWVARLAVAGPAGADGVVASRVRLIGGDRARTVEWLGGSDRAALWAEPVTMAGPVELFTLLREQAVSARAHRHGLAVAVPGLDELLEP